MNGKRRVAAPKFFKKIPERDNEAFLRCEKDILFVVVLGGARPIVASTEEKASIENCELVVHMVDGPVHAHGDAESAEAFDVRPRVKGFIVVRDDANFDPAAMGANNGVSDAIVGNGEDTDVDKGARIAEKRGLRRFRFLWAAQGRASKAL